MVKIQKEYTLNGPNGPVTLDELFDGKRQLIVYHFMFGPGEESEPCHGCSFHIDQMPTHLGVLRQRNTNYVIVSRAPYEDIAAWQKRLGWPQLWVSSSGSDFNYDFHATNDPEVGPMESNFRKTDRAGEESTLSVFYRGEDGGIYHTYQSFARGTDHLLVSLQLLDLTPLGRQHVDRTAPGGNQYHDEIDA